MNIMFRVTEDDNVHVKSGSPTKQHFVFVRRTTEVTTVYGEVKIFTPFLNTEGADRRKIFFVVWDMKIKRTFPFAGYHDVISTFDTVELSIPYVPEEK